MRSGFLLLLLLAGGAGCSTVAAELERPEFKQWLEAVSNDAAGKAADSLAAQLEITDQKVIDELKRQAEIAARVAGETAVAAVKQKGTELEATVAENGAKILEAVAGGAGATGAATGNPLLIALGGLGGFFAAGLRQRAAKKKGEG